MLSESRVFFSIRFRFIFLAMALIIISGCSLKMFSSGWDLAKKAQEALNRGDYSEALYLASESIIADEKLEEPKILIKENHDTVLRKLKSELRSLKISRIKGAEKSYYIQHRLNKYFNNLKNIKIPLEDKDGKWTFSPKMEDFSQRAENARINARKVLLKYAKRYLKKERFEEVEKLYNKVINIYTKESSEKQRYTVIMRKSLSEGYYKRGLKVQRRGGIQNLEHAVADFDKSVQWDSLNDRAVSELSKAKRKLAEIYYRKGKRLERRNRTASANAYAAAIKWFPGYKDAKQRIVDLFVSKELIDLEINIAETERLVNDFGREPEELARNASKAMDAMNKMTYLSDKLRDADEKMKSISSTLSAFNMIPMVSNATRVVNGVIDKSRNKLHPAVKKFDRFEKPVITPTKDNISKVDRVTGQLNQNIKDVEMAVSTARRSIGEINRCIERQNDPYKIIELGKKAEDINVHIKNVNRSLRFTNAIVGSIGPAVKKIADMRPTVKKAADSASRLAKPINKIEKATHEIDKVLKKKITLRIPIIRKKVSLSIHKILTKSVPKIARKILNKFSKIAMKALNPVLRKLKVRIPSVPGLNKIKSEINNMKYGYRKLRNKAMDFRKRVTDLNENTRNLNMKIEEARNTVCNNI